jgi:hypothetical protein
MTEGEAKGIAHGAIEASSKVLTALPAQFLLVILLNAAFLVCLFWFLDRRDSARERMITPVISACLKGQS